VSDPGNEGFYRPTFYDEVNNTLTASTDVINIIIGPHDPEERRVTVRRFLPPHPEGQQIIAKFMSYFVGKPTQFDVELPVNIGTDFQRSIWAALGDIPYGEYETYGEFALRLGRESNPGHWQCCGTESVAKPLSLPPDRRLHGCPYRISGRTSVESSTPAVRRCCRGRRPSQNQTPVGVSSYRSPTLLST